MYVENLKREMKAIEVYLYMKEVPGVVTIILPGEKFGRDFNINNFMQEFKKEIGRGLLEIITEQKPEQMQSYQNRLVAFKDDSSIDWVEIEVYDQGIYVMLEDVRSQLKIFINNQGKATRKPAKAIANKRMEIRVA